jgi:glycosyltransferase involved in cell wall biosynthesis
LGYKCFVILLNINKMNTTFSTPKVSVIIPVFNEEKYILQTLNAIISQSCKNYELIIVDNNSTDATNTIIKYFIQSTPTSIPITYVTEQRQGTNYARECGRRLATGQIIALLDADCLPDFYWVNNGCKTLQQKKTVAATGAYFYYDASILLKMFSLISQLIIFKLINRMIQINKKGAILIGGNAFINAALLQTVGGFNTNLTFYGDDIDIAIKLSKYGNVSYATVLTIKTSSRRFKACGFWKVNKKYQTIFKDLLLGKTITSSQSMELMHPR